MIKNPNYINQSDKTIKIEIRQEKIMPAFLITLYFYYLLAPPLLFSSDTKWYLHLTFCFLIFLLQGKILNVRACKLYFYFWGLYIIGAILSSFRTLNIINNLYLIIGSSISYFTFLLLIPSLASRYTRKWMLVGLSLAALTWIVIIKGQTSNLSYLTNPYYLKGPDNDKNYIAFVLSLAVTAVFCLAVLWDPRKKLSKGQASTIRIGVILFGLFILYWVFFTYSRSGLITTTIGLLSVAVLYIVTKRKTKRIWALFVLAFFVFFAYTSLPFILQSVPQWLGYFSEDRLGMRVNDIQKSIEIISDNPFIGIGLDESKNSYNDFERGLPHNLYLKTWAEVGITGVIGFVLWLIFFLKMLRDKFYYLVLVDQIWLIVYIPLFTMAIFLDILTIAIFMLALMTGIFYNKTGITG